MYQQPYPQYGTPYQQYQAPVPGAVPGSWQQPQPKRRIEFVDGEAGAQAYQLGPGESAALFDSNGTMTVWLKGVGDDGVPMRTARYHLTEEDSGGVEARMAAMEEQIRELREAIDGKPVPDVRTTATAGAAAPRHVASAGDGAGA